jgi:hypothetical protein
VDLDPQATKMTTKWMRIMRRKGQEMAAWLKWVILFLPPLILTNLVMKRSIMSTWSNLIARPPCFPRAESATSELILYLLYIISCQLFPPVVKFWISLYWETSRFQNHIFEHVSQQTCSTEQVMYLVLV